MTSGGNGPGPRLHMPNLGDRWFAFNLVTTTARDLQLLIVRDVTNEARLESMRRDFVANASHELRSPLTVVRGYLDTLAEDTSLDEGWREPVREMQRQSERMHSIVQDLLELSRLEAGKGEAELEPVDVGGMLALIRREVLARPEHPATFELEPRIGRAAARGRIGAALDLSQPDHERGQVHAGRRPCLGAVLDRRRRAVTLRSRTPASASRPSTFRA